MKKSHIMIMVVIAVIAIALALLMAYAIVEHMSKETNEAPTTDSELIDDSVVTVPSAAEDDWNTADTTASAATKAATTEAEDAPAVGEVETMDEPTIVSSAIMETEDKFLVLLNRTHKMEDNYMPQLEEAVAGTGVYLEAEAAAAYSRMYDDAFAQGVTLTPMSGYRSYDRQSTNYENLAAEFLADGYSDEEAHALAAKEILPPGCSEHNYGLAMDIGWIDQNFAGSAEYKWLVDNAADYGFIERYTEEKRDKTGIIPEPWHWRYVGSADIAHDIENSGFCLEEYLESRNASADNN